MKPSFLVVDDFVTDPEGVRQSALAAGLGTWRPNKGEVGSSVYDGMGFWGKHAEILRRLSMALGSPVFPNSLFFRVTNKGTEKAYVHSDRESGNWTCVTYLSHHSEGVSGTGFFRHRELGLTEMPTFSEMKERGIFEQLKSEMVDGSDDVWEQIDFVRGVFNRAVIFRAPLFHARFPKNGFGESSEDGRLVHVTHFERE